MELKNTVIKGSIWKFFERFLTQGISLIVTIVLARILLPTDYGVVSMVTIFFTFANVLITGGLNTALVQKEDADFDDYSTVFTLSLIISVILYIVLFFIAPLISNIYNQPLLINIMRVMGLSLPIYSIKSIVCAYTSATLQFKKFFYSTLGGTIVSGIVGIVMAEFGCGAWAIVAQQMVNAFIDTIILFITTRLKIRFYISITKFKKLFSYGWKILLSSLISVVYLQVNPLIIGLKYSSADLSFYTKGRSFPEVLSSSLIATFSSVIFPVLAKVQNNKEKLLEGTRRFMQMVSFIICPLMFGFFAVADTFVMAILTEKWLPIIFYIRIFCFSGLCDIIAIGNCETIKAMGRSDIYLKMELCKKFLYFITIGLFVFFSNSPQVLSYSILVMSIISVIINIIPNIKLINYTLIKQFKDLFMNFLIATIMCIIVLLIGKVNFNIYLKLFVQILSGGIVYILLAIITKNKNFIFLVDYIKNKFIKKNREKGND